MRGEWEEQEYAQLAVLSNQYTALEKILGHTSGLGYYYQMRLAQRENDLPKADGALTAFTKEVLAFIDQKRKGCYDQLIAFNSSNDSELMKKILENYIFMFQTDEVYLSMSSGEAYHACLKSMKQALEQMQEGEQSNIKQQNMESRKGRKSQCHINEYF